MHKLSESPGTWFDEGIYIQIARNAQMHLPYALRASPTEMVPAGRIATAGFPVIAPISLSFKLFGVGLLQARAVMVVYILLLVAAVYLFAYSIWGFRTAMWSTLLVATHAPVYGNGKNVLGEVPGLFFFFVLLYLAYKLERDKGRSIPLWLGTGLAAGMFMATKPNFLLLLPVLCIAGVFCRKRFMPNWKGMLSGVVAMLVPLATFVMTTFGLSTPLTSVFAGYGSMPGLRDVTGMTLPQLILKNIGLFFHESTPALLLCTFVAWFAYAIIRLRKKTEVPLHEYVALGFTAATILYFLKMPGFYRYLFVAQIITFPYLVESVDALVTRRKAKIVSAAVFVLAIVFQFYLLCFHSWVAGHYQGTRTKELTEYFQQLDSSTRVFFYHVPEAITFFRGEAYWQYFQLLYYADAFGKEQAPVLVRGESDLVIVSRDLESDAQTSLGMYRKDREIDHGRYVVYTRK